jgi:putative ABC transport system permease protein
MREIDPPRAIGMRGRAILAMFSTESAWQGCIATGAALIIMTPVAVWLSLVGIDIAGRLPESVPVLFGGRFYTDYEVWHFLVAVAGAVLVGLVGSIRPARRAARLSVADAMRRVG